MISTYKRLTCAAVALGATLIAAPARADVILSENFDDISTLAGWTAVNNSTPGGIGWFQGNSGIFDAQGGAADSYIASNFLASGFPGDISNWLILPTLNLSTDDTLTFFTRSSGFFPDRLEVRYASGATTNVGATTGSVGDFTTLLLTLNPALAGDGYPTDWTRYTVSLAFLGSPDRTPGTLAFRYNVSDTSVNADYIGIDTVSVERVPEPGLVAFVSLGLAGLIASRRRPSQQKGA